MLINDTLSLQARVVSGGALKVFKLNIVVVRQLFANSRKLGGIKVPNASFVCGSFKVLRLFRGVVRGWRPVTYWGEPLPSGLAECGRLFGAYAVMTSVLL